jgi:protein-tyrosine kinase
MGRVQDAMKRAADREAAGDVSRETPNDVTAGLTDDVLGARDATALAQEPFPDEAAVGLGGNDDPAGAAVLRGEAEGGVALTGGASRNKVPGTGLLQRLGTDLNRKVVIDQDMVPASREQYRRLAATLHQAQAMNGMKVVLIASAVAGEGKTLTVSNLALTFSESYKRSVLVIDGDLRKPSVHTVFGIAGSPGLTEGLSSIEEPSLPLHRVTERLTVLPAGRPSGDPMAGLTSDRMRRVIREARDSFDWVFVDTAPIGLLTDANLLASWVDAAILVIKADSTPFPLVQRAIEALGRDRVLGTVLNRAVEPALHGSGYEYYGKYYTSAPGA